MTPTPEDGHPADGGDDAGAQPDEAAEPEREAPEGNELEDQELERYEEEESKLKRLDAEPRMVRAARAFRRLLPGDREYGDPLSTAGDEPSQLLGKRLAERASEKPSAMRELGLSALQVWQSLSEAQGRGRGDVEVAILFTDLVEFSEWALKAGDTLAVDLLREVSWAVDPCVEGHGGKIVKRLGDGLMAAFPEPQEAVEAAIESCAAVQKVEVAGHRPELRAGVHLGKPRKVGGDYLGTDVNIAARVADAAGGGEVLVSDVAAERLDPDGFKLKKRWRFSAKGAPRDLMVYTAKPLS
ncbi:MAG: adenylate/guanylate cyclase domain-containing protein [Thermoleophilaceae bacterium]